MELWPVESSPSVYPSINGCKFPYFLHAIQVQGGFLVYILFFYKLLIAIRQIILSVPFMIFIYNANIYSTSIQLHTGNSNNRLRSHAVIVLCDFLKTFD